jgi:hypothetical protein
MGLLSPFAAARHSGFRGVGVGPPFDYMSGMAKLRTYAEACEELGGVPWRRVDVSERWFVQEPAQPATILESAAIFIGRPSLWRAFRDVPRTTWLIVIAAGALLSFAVALLG